jgi:hypothetical protein
VAIVRPWAIDETGGGDEYWSDIYEKNLLGHCPDRFDFVRPYFGRL